MSDIVFIDIEENKKKTMAIMKNIFGLEYRDKKHPDDIYTPRYFEENADGNLETITFFDKKDIPLLATDCPIKPIAHVVEYACFLKYFEAVGPLSL